MEYNFHRCISRSWIKWQWVIWDARIS